MHPGPWHKLSNSSHSIDAGRAGRLRRGTASKILFLSTVISIGTIPLVINLINILSDRTEQLFFLFRSRYSVKNTSSLSRSVSILSITRFFEATERLW